MLSKKFSVFGCGRMAEAIVGGIIGSKLISPENFYCYDVNEHKSSEFQNLFNVNVVQSPMQAAEICDINLVSVKPQNIPDLSLKVNNKFRKDSMLISICAGITLEDLNKSFSVDNTIRVMPNTPSLVNEGMSVWIADKRVDEENCNDISELLRSFGKEHQVHNENEIDIATALTGTGPTFLFMLNETLIDSGVHLGLSREVASKLVTQMLKGSVLLAESKSKVHPVMLRNDITSAGGTSANAIYMMEKGNFRTVMSDAVWSAYKRSLQLGGKDISKIGSSF